ncbi:MAG: PDDEXK nuclease domain-containing protein [Sulfurimonas sp.]|jgi:hypothetical protein|nr:PDDEXK nuclease domain-containing protein [Sulfurimonas sp.]
MCKTHIENAKNDFFQDIKSILQLARNNAYKSVNFIMVEAYWNIGKKIVQEEQKGNDRAEYGTYIIKELSAQLTIEFGKGFSAQSLWNMRQFYNAFPILSTLWRELSWSHYKLLIGRGFAFVARQKRIKTQTSDFYIDLVFYNYLLKCFVLIDLKIGKLTHQDIGQIDMYVNMYDDLEKDGSDNPTIGIILCTDKDETVVKYSHINDRDNFFVSKYQMVLPTEEELIRKVEGDVLEIGLEKEGNLQSC